MHIEPDPFLSPALTSSNLDLYVVRSSILRSLKEALPKFSGRFCDVGAGNQPYKTLFDSSPAITEYIPLDLADSGPYRACENTWDGVTMPFESDSLDCAMATEVLEHCPDAEIVLKEVARVVKPGGLFFFTVPFIWPLHNVPNDEYRYTPFSLERHLLSAGFSDIDIQPTGGWNASLAQVIGLYVRRGPMGTRRRKWLSKMAVPIVKYLMKRDSVVSKESYERFLMPGLSGTARVEDR